MSQLHTRAGIELMAWSSASLDATVVANYAADYPMALAAHVLRDTVLAVEKWTVTGSEAATDHTETGPPPKPVAYAYDGKAHLGAHTVGDLSNANQYINIGFDEPVTFDCLVLHTTDVDDWDNVDVDIADDGAFTSNAETIATLSIGDGFSRMVALELYHTGSDPLVYSDVEHLRLHFNRSSGSGLARVRELWIGTRIQLGFHPREPWSGHFESSHSPGVVTRDGHVYSHRLGSTARGGREVSVLLESSTELAAAKRIWDESLQGTEPFYWIETPSSDPKAYLVRFRGEFPAYAPTLRMGPERREWKFSLAEQNPYLALEA